MRGQLGRAYPQLAYTAIAASWRGLIDYSISGLPFLCRLHGSSQVLVCAGFSGNGVGPSRLAGDVLAEMALEDGNADLPPALAQLPRGRSLPSPSATPVGASSARRSPARSGSRIASANRMW